MAAYVGAEAKAPIYAVEWGLEARKELVCARPRAEHMFTNINEFWDPSYDVDSSWTHEALQAAMIHGKPVKTSGWCVLCSKECAVSRTFCHIAGTPCPDWSTQGARSGVQGKGITCTMAWAALRYEIEDDASLNENVRMFFFSCRCCARVPVPKVPHGFCGGEPGGSGVAGSTHPPVDFWPAPTLGCGKPALGGVCWPGAPQGLGHALDHFFVDEPTSVEEELKGAKKRKGVFVAEPYSRSHHGCWQGRP